MKRSLFISITIATILFLSFSLFACNGNDFYDFRTEIPAPALNEDPSASERTDFETETITPDISDENEKNSDNTFPAENANERTADAAFSFTPPDSPYEYYVAAVANANVNVRKGVATSYPVLFTLSEGLSLPFLWEENGWFAIWTGERVGYVMKSYAYLSRTNEAIENVLSAGIKKLGTPYEWGAARVLGDGGKKNPYFTGRSFDCSSFVQYCFYVGDGVKLGAYTGSQADHTIGKTIYDYSALQRGDFYFTGANDKISHVVLYLGGGKLLQCYSANGGPVSVTEDARWKKNFISGRRVDLSVKNQFS